MPLVQTRGAASAQGFGEFAQAAPPAEFVDDVFSTFLYTGNGSTQTINNGIDLAGEGGLVWIKSRNKIEQHGLYDTARGASQWMPSNGTNASTDFIPGGVSSFNSNGFTVFDNTFGSYAVNGSSSSQTYCSWTFRKAPKFFDVVTYTGNGSNPRAISHNLGSIPGCMIVKVTSASAAWYVYHRSAAAPGFTAAQSYMALNETNDVTDNAFIWGNTAPTSTQFTVSTQLNSNGVTFVAYLFAHDAGGFGTAGTDNVISCGSWSAGSSNGNFDINLGYEPQYVLIKRTDSTSDWKVFDVMRGLQMVNASTGAGVEARPLFPNLSNAEGSGEYVGISATGFNAAFSGGGTFIYMAIRRPMKPPTSGTQVFLPAIRTGTGADATITSTIAPVDFTWIRQRNAGSGYSFMLFDRLRGALKLFYTDNTQSENNTSGTVTGFDVQNGYYLGADASGYGTNVSGQNIVYYNFRRATGFFDIVCYTGNGTAGRTINHNLGVPAELKIYKSRSAAHDWLVINQNLVFALNTSDAAGGGGSNFPSTSTTFTVSNGVTNNASGTTYVAYLFATIAGVSKVGSYTGTGATQTINCGFTGGARFVLIKRTDSTGDWFVWDTARGISSGNDPYLLLNSSAAEVTNTDFIDPASSGFEISSTAPAAINASGGSFIFLAIA